MNCSCRLNNILCACCRQSVAVQPSPVSNGAVLELWGKKTSIEEFYQHISTKFDDWDSLISKDALCTTVRNLKIKKVKLSKSKRQLKELEFFINATFVPPSPTGPRLSGSGVDTKICVNSDLNASSSCSNCAIQLEVTRDLCEENDMLKTELGELRKTDTAQRAHIAILQEKVRKYSVKRINQQIKRLRKQLREKEARLKKLQKLSNVLIVQRLKTKIKDLKNQKKSQRVYYRKRLSQMNQDQATSSKLDIICRELSSDVMDLRNENNALKESLMCSEQDATRDSNILTTKDGRSYNAKIRMTMYHCLGAQVPVNKAGPLVAKILKELTGIQLEETPTTSTICQMGREMGIISDIQVGDALHSGEATIGFDATSIAGAHLNEMHICSSTGESLTAGVAQLPGGCAADYVGHIKDTLKDVASVYADMRNVEVEAANARMTENIACSITDRCPVNHAVIRKLSDDMNKEIVELNCNVHPLDGIASKARSILKEIETTAGIRGTLFGKDACVVNTIHAVSKMRYKAGTGDPSGFKAYLKSQGMSPGLIVRYIGNRLHVLFHLAGVIFSKKELILHYLDKMCPTRNGLRTSLVTDMKNESIILEIQCLAMWGKVLTGPWMTLFYGNSGHLHHLEFIPHMNTCIDSLRRIQQTPDLMTELQKDVFGQAVSHEGPSDTTAMGMVTNRTTVNHINSLLAKGFVQVLERQLKAYLTGELSDPSDELLAKTASAPPHNIHSESALGMLDHQLRRAPNAQVDFAEAKVKFAVNSTLKWIEEQPDKYTIIKYAAKKARKLTGEKKERRDECQREIQERLKLTARKKDKSLRDRVERSISTLHKAGSVRHEDLQQLQPVASDDQITQALGVVHDPANLVGEKIIHRWFDDDEQGDIEYEGHVTKYKSTQRGLPKFVIGYFNLSTESLDDSVDYNIPLKQVVADILFGDLYVI